jgi:hypothetical protein
MATDQLLELEAEIRAAARRLAFALAPISLVALAAVLV